MTKTYNAGTRVEGGYYFNLDDWSMTSGVPPSTGAAKDMGLVQ